MEKHTGKGQPNANLKLTQTHGLENRFSAPDPTLVESDFFKRLDPGFSDSDKAVTAIIVTA